VKLRKTTQAVTTTEVIQLDLIGDKLNHEISIVSFGVPENYEWSLIDVLNEALKQVLACFDRLI
jgi:hypothetical protein